MMRLVVLPQPLKTGLVFAALVFWLVCFGMSLYSRFLERRLRTDHRR
jgi:general L-amino acid transport system permease protein